VLGGLVRAGAGNKAGTLPDMPTDANALLVGRQGLGGLVRGSACDAALLNTRAGLHRSRQLSQPADALSSSVHPRHAH
jgi:hypothetical protein